MCQIADFVKNRNASGRHVAFVVARKHHGAVRSDREDCMRLAIIGIVTLAAGLAADVQAASAQNESFWQKLLCEEWPLAPVPQLRL
jgi:hypothetical protein